MNKGSIGKPRERVDGRLKVTGQAKYAAEFEVPNLAYCWLVQSTIAKGRVESIDTSEAEHAPGVLAVITAGNMPALPKPTTEHASPQRPLLTDEIVFSGQNIAVVVAETLEQAEYAASLVKATYRPEQHNVLVDGHFDEAISVQNAQGKDSHVSRGQLDAGLQESSLRLDQTYRTPTEHHNAMEPHATVAWWSDDAKLTAYDATQGVNGTQNTLAGAFGVPPRDVHVMSPFIGGGFGSKGQSWPHTRLAALAAKVVKRPVKLVLTRKQMFTSNGHRPETIQHNVFGSNEEGKLLAMQHADYAHTSIHETFGEPTGNVFRMLYSCPNVDIDEKLIRLNVPAPTYMRAPGEASGSFSMETAMDEVAEKLGLDPLEFWLRNYAETDEMEGKPYTSKSLRECYARGAEAFGWSKRNAAVGSMKERNLLVGYGMATATYPSNYWNAAARIEMDANGNVLVQICSQDIGTGTYTILGQVAADAVGISPDLVTVQLADSRLPFAPLSAGSNSATTAGSAVLLAARKLKDQLTKGNKPPLSVEVSAGTGRGPGAQMELDEHWDSSKYSAHGFGAHFCEVHIDPDLRTIRVARWVGAFALGTVLNERTLRSQLLGAIVWGIGMGLMEETYVDANLGRYLNTNLAEYHVPTNKDVPPIQVIIVPEEDEHVSPIGAKGGGEIGIVGAAAAIGNAVYHATGKRIRHLPITLDKIL